jgi:putative ATP-dependent DNA ligase
VYGATWDDVDYYRFEKDVHDLRRGTVLIPGLEVIHEFPHLPRILHLARGLAANLDRPFHVEEKLDGYNVRILWARGRTLAFTRGGYVCPFATDRLPDFPAVLRFVERHPRLVLCAEIAGPGNPYNLERTPHVREDIGLFAFDLQEQGTGKLLPPDEKYRLLDEAEVPSVRRFGTFRPDEAARLHEVVAGIDAEGGEGVVLKPPDGSVGVKYVGFGTNVRDLSVSANLVGSVPRAFVVNKLVQAAFCLHEWGPAPADAAAFAEACRRFGRAILEPLAGAIAAVEGDEDVDERYEVLLREEANADRLLRHLDRASTSVQVKLLDKRRVGDRWRVTFVKRYQRSSGLFRSRLLGASFVD